MTYSYSEMQGANQAFCAADFVHYAFREAKLTGDFVGALVDVLLPAVEIVEGRVLVPSIGALERYHDYRALGETPAEAQYWANLLEPASLFGIDHVVTVRRLVELVAKCWENVLASTTFADAQGVFIVDDPEEDEIFVTIAAMRNDQPLKRQRPAAT